MFIKVILAFLPMIASADYGVPPIPSTQGGGSIGIGSFEHAQSAERLVESVLTLAKANSALRAKVQEKLVAMAIREEESYAYLQELQSYFTSTEFLAMDPELQDQERSQARIVLELSANLGSLK